MIATAAATASAAAAAAVTNVALGQVVSFHQFEGIRGYENKMQN